MDQTDRRVLMKLSIGQIISGVGHGALIGYAMLGEVFSTPERDAPISVQEVSLMTEAQFAALTQEPVAPTLSEQAPNLRPVVSDSAPLSADPPRVQPPVSRPPIPSPEPVLEDVGAGLPDVPNRPPAPRPIPRISDRVVINEQPEPTERPDLVQEQATSEQVSENIVEEAVEQTTRLEESTTEIIPEVIQPAGISTSPRPRVKPAPPIREAQNIEEDIQDIKDAQVDISEVAADALALAAADLLAQAASDLSGAESAPIGAPITSGEREGVRVALRQCWSVGRMSSEAMRTIVTVGVTMNEDGTPDVASISLLGHQGGTDASARLAFEVARSAIIRCGARGFPLPAEKYAQWRELELSFDPENMRSR